MKYIVSKSQLDGSGKRLDTIDLQYFDQAQGNWVLRSAPTVVVYDGEEASIDVPYADAAGSTRRVKMTMTVKLVGNQEFASLYRGKLPALSLCPDMGETNLPVIDKVGESVTPRVVASVRGGRTQQADDVSGRPAADPPR